MTAWSPRPARLGVGLAAGAVAVALGAVALDAGDSAASADALPWWLLAVAATAAAGVAPAPRPDRRPPQARVSSNR